MNPVELYSEVYACDPDYKISKHRFDATVKFLKICGVKELKKEEWRTLNSVDVCCGRGEIVDYFEYLGYMAMGTEIVPELMKDGRIHRMHPFPAANDLSIPYGNIQILTCFDALEHFTEEGVDSALEMFSRSYSKEIILSISTKESTANTKHGKAEGESLHLTVRPPSWWIFKLKKYWSDSMAVMANQSMGMLWIHIRNR